MRVNSIVIDGFKSYAHRKELSALSPHFNAITGLNGSGKSNIFDAICFVMGITNLKRVRAEDPRELIFRAGTTGVHAARVTIEFLNDDPATAPPGYSCEDYPIITIGRQIKLGGKQQFFFNNTVSMQSKVKRFFESISLNVDNPHFMVLQGTVHKLIGMRSQDILSLIEEAVGTRTFDHRRRTAEALMRAKEKKMEEIDANIETQISPMLLAMKADQEEYNRYLQVSEGLEEKKRFRIAFEYYDRYRELGEREAAVAEKQQDAATAREQLRGMPSQEAEMERRLLVLQQSLQAPSDAVAALHEEEDEAKRALSRSVAQLEACAKQLKHLEQQLTAFGKERERQKVSQAQFQARKEEHSRLLDQIREARETREKLKHALQLVRSGVRAGASGVSLDEERAQIDVRLIQHAAEVKRLRESAADLVGQLEAVQRRSAQQAGQVKRLEADLATATRAFEREEKRYAPLAPKERRAAELEGLIAAAKREHQTAFEAFQRDAGARSFDLDFDRRACSPGIESRIHGRVGELVFPKEDKYKLGLMVGAQTFLLRAVVDTDGVAEEIIKANLRQRTAFLALNKLQAPRAIDADRLAEAQRIAQRMGGTVAVAKDLVSLRSEAFRALADYVFGGFLVCSSLALAQELAYSAGVKVKAVTLDGEVAEPNGLMSGGAVSQLRDVFGELAAFQTRRAPIAALAGRVAELEGEYRGLRAELERQADVLQSYKAAEEALEVARQRCELAQGNTQGALADVEAQLQRTRAAAEEREAEVAALQARRAEIEREVAADPDTARAGLETELQRTEKHLQKLTKEEEEGAAAFERMEADTEQQATDLAARTRDAEDERAERTAERAALEARVAEERARVEDVQKRRAQTEDQRLRLEREIEETQEDQARLTERRASLERLAKNADADLKEMSRAVEECRRQVREAERRHAWLQQETERFGAADGPYYFEDAARTAQTLQELREAEAQAAVLSKKMNKKSTVLYEDRRAEFEELVKQRAALAEDKAAIQACIRGIESKKWNSLDRMVHQVSDIFGKLFATCLPNASAELLEERDDTQHLCGLGVRVSFNGKAKESLSELSGGQRSLLALCLILAILRVRSAPIYILDEVDAALDPSHTQNIGRMLQLYFPRSQFLLVSLKDGMYNNANVLYHVRNTQGYSEISRVEHK